MNTSLENILEAAQRLPLAERRELIARLSAEECQGADAQIEANLDIARDTRGTIKGLDRKTLISIAEDEEYCGY
ncbi:MAG: hypothetical protein ACRD63_01980 [Pyrinomonadaceae bacterium]